MNPEIEKIMIPRAEFPVRRPIHGNSNNGNTNNKLFSFFHFRIISENKIAIMNTDQTEFIVIHIYISFESFKTKDDTIHNIVTSKLIIVLCQKNLKIIML